MTEKRFELNDMGNGVEDIFNGEKFNICECCDKMNEQELRIDKLENQVIVLNKKQNKTLVGQIKELEKENEQLKSEITILKGGYDVSDKNFILNQLVTKQKDLINELSNENRLLDKKLRKSEREKQHMRNVIKESMQNERTHLGYNALKQLAERLEII